jgi:hypothetical protein
MQRMSRCALGRISHWGCARFWSERKKDAEVSAGRAGVQQEHVGTAVPGCPAAQVYRVAAFLRWIIERREARLVIFLTSSRMRVPHPSAFFALGWEGKVVDASGPRSRQVSKFQQALVRSSHPCKERKDGAPVSWWSAESEGWATGLSSRYTLFK